MNEVVNIAKDFGPWIALAGFLVWQLVRDKAELVKTSREDRKETMMLHERSVKALENNTAYLDKLTVALHERPCLAKEKR